MYVCMYACMHVCMYAYMYVTYVCIYVCIMYVCVRERVQNMPLFIFICSPLHVKNPFTIKDVSLLAVVTPLLLVVWR